jgi:hypothetical protein
MKKAVLAVVVGLSAIVVPSAAGQTPAQDSVIGTGVAQAGTAFTFDIDARSGPSGESPTGQVTFRSVDTGELFFAGPVTCLDVSGNFAILDVATSQYGVVGLEVTDSPSGDLIRGIPTGVSTCAPIGTAVDFRVVAGDVVVHDATPLPTSKDQCKNGGWRSYGVFKNQGDCVSFVATRGKNPPAKAG